mmetsp:Transcript_62161/g.148288  ORF Transcript_62161/g.148288 Transcript_62161/m.148288 type:complete len:361 (+) Transcript_62161:98-1180(+)|eukprot:CAMPEP_0178396446 /NCGR_PEP_ID=MMETSP0689_2-20121128/13732_1 /TAXON_ID=160604 /ORGANISM="Amphidinium massartii, Strain CS-259" /LENGTH=360 /DNA_ID=CAMNT_0020017119 /DNA_START=38 /DNA_END=1120 /DNA_ORIENTATION=-
MESAIKYLLKTYFEEYVLGLDNIDTSKLPVTLSNLTLKEAKIKEGMEQDSDSPLQFMDGSIGKVQLRPVSIFGQIQVVASDVVLNLNFNPIKAVKKAILPAVDDESDLQNQVPLDIQEQLAAMPSISAIQASLLPPSHPPAMPSTGQSSPAFCRMHNSSERRPKAHPRRAPCSACGLVLDTNYAELAYCAACSQKQRRCMICGETAVAATSSTAPVDAARGGDTCPKQLGQQRCAPVRSASSPPIPEPEDLPDDHFAERLSIKPIFSSNIRASSRSHSGPAGQAQPTPITMPGSAVSAVASLLPGSFGEGIACGTGGGGKKDYFGFLTRCDISQCSSTRLHDSRDYTHVEPALLPKSLIT